MNDTLAQILGLTDIHYLTDEVSKESLIRIGKIKPMSLLDFSQYVKIKFNLDSLRVAGDLNKIIETVSIVGGSGSSEFFKALKFSDVLITGQIPHHLGIEAVENNFGLIEVTHAIEFYGLETIKNKLQQKFNIEIIVSNSNFDPFKTI
jgi:putative NIF3 family GTP cyclohydrolase 1 type 2